MIAKLDRLYRSVREGSTFLESGIPFVSLDLPEVTDRCMYHFYLVMAEKEASLISSRTKAALQAARARGVKLGGPLGAAPLLAYARGHELGTAAARAKADEYAQRLVPMIE